MKYLNESFECGSCSAPALPTPVARCMFRFITIIMYLFISYYPHSRSSVVVAAVVPRLLGGKAAFRIHLNTFKVCEL